MSRCTAISHGTGICRHSKEDHPEWHDDAFGNAWPYKPVEFTIPKVELIEARDFELLPLVIDHLEENGREYPKYDTCKCDLCRTRLREEGFFHMARVIGLIQ